jgi:hypothetical protein
VSDDEMLRLTTGTGATSRPGDFTSLILQLQFKSCLHGRERRVAMVAEFEFHSFSESCKNDGRISARATRRYANTVVLIRVVYTVEYLDDKGLFCGCKALGSQYEDERRIHRDRFKSTRRDNTGESKSAFT